MERHPMFMDWKTYYILFKMAILPQTIYRFSVVPIKTPVPAFFCIKEKPNSHIYLELQGVPNSQNNTEEEKVWGLTLLNFKIYCKAEIISYWHTVDIWTDQTQLWVEKLIICSQFIFDMGAQFSTVTQLCLTVCDPWTAAHQASLSITNSWSLLKLMSIESVMPSNHLILCHPLLLLPSVFPSIMVFSNESVFHIRYMGAKNIQ